MTATRAEDKTAKYVAALARISTLARREADAGAPAGMVATYVEIEVWHALVNHSGDAQRCDSCHELLGR